MNWIDAIFSGAIYLSIVAVIYLFIYWLIKTIYDTTDCLSHSSTKDSFVTLCWLIGIILFGIFVCIIHHFGLHLVIMGK